MKYSLFLLALVLGSAVGIDVFEANVWGASASGLGGALGYVPAEGDTDFPGGTCDTCIMNGLFERCVNNKAVARGAVLTPPSTARRELRGNRRLCPSYCPERRYVGQWCWVKCGGGRRLTFADEVSSERSLFESSDLLEVQTAAQKCYEEAAAKEEFSCLGAKEAIAVKVYHSVVV
jgi:hypothetical protein